MKKNDEYMNYIRLFQLICFEIFMISFISFVMPFYGWNIWIALMLLAGFEFYSLGFLAFWIKENEK